MTALLLTILTALCVQEVARRKIAEQDEAAAKRGRFFDTGVIRRM